jgi:hypothetical protein
MGIGRLRTAGLVRPDPQWETRRLFARDPDFFLLRYARELDPDLMLRSHEEHAGVLKNAGVHIERMELENRIGAYGPMRKLFIGTTPGSRGRAAPPTRTASTRRCRCSGGPA